LELAEKLAVDLDGQRPFAMHEGSFQVVQALYAVVLAVVPAQE
jgi:hypothetical protein